MDDIEFDIIPEQDLIESIQKTVKYLRRRELITFICDIMKELAPGRSIEELIEIINKFDPNAI